MIHPLAKFLFCPCCGSAHFEVNDFKSKRCTDCGFTFYHNSAAATVAVILNSRNELLVTRRAFNPAAGTLDLPGGFVDAGELLRRASCAKWRKKQAERLSWKSSYFPCPTNTFIPISSYTPQIFSFYANYSMKRHLLHMMMPQHFSGSLWRTYAPATLG